jgi:hypothetical protein
MTQALSGLNGAFYRDDPTISSVAFSNVLLTNWEVSVNQDYQDVSSTYFWDGNLPILVEYRRNGIGPWYSIDPSSINCFQRKVHFDTPLNDGDLVRVSGYSRNPANLVRIFNLLDGTLTWNQKVQDCTSQEDSGWESSVRGIEHFDFTTNTYFYYNPAGPDYIDLRDLGKRLIAKLYSYATNDIAWIGYVQLVGNDLQLVSMNKAQTKQIKFSGNGLLWPTPHEYSYITNFGNNKDLKFTSLVGLGATLTIDITEKGGIGGIFVDGYDVYVIATEDYSTGNDILYAINSCEESSHIIHVSLAAGSNGSGSWSSSLPTVLLKGDT